MPETLKGVDGLRSEVSIGVPQGDLLQIGKERLTSDNIVFALRGLRRVAATLRCASGSQTRETISEMGKEELESKRISPIRFPRVLL